MNRRLIAACLVAAFSLLSPALPAHDATPRLALSFDDGLDPRQESRAAEWNRAILASLAATDVKAIFYVTGKYVDSPEGLALVRDWGESGHAIGNHSYSHANLNSSRVSLEDFIADVSHNQALLEDLPGWTPRFRFPYLKEGDTAEKRDGMRQWLADNGYESGAVGIDASDWYFSSRFQDWQETHPDADPAPFREAYLGHLRERAQYYDGLSQQLLDRHAALVLLLHTNAINAAFLSDVIRMFRAEGWEIVAPEEAYADPLYSLQPDTLPAGESILWSLAKAKGIEGLRYPAEDGRYEKDRIDAIETLRSR